MDKKEYIDRDKAMLAAMDYTGNGDAQDVSQDIAAAIMAIPPADVVEVIRCQNCTCCQWKNELVTYGWCTKHFENVMRDEYCSWAESENELSSDPSAAMV